MHIAIDFDSILARYDLPARFKAEFLVLARENIHRAHSQTRVSGRELSLLSQTQRMQLLLSMAVDLRRGGYSIMSPYNFAEKHVRWLVHRWVLEKQFAVGSVELRLTHLRAFCSWMRKSNMVGTLDDYVERPEGYVRSYIAKTDRSWEGNQIDAAAKIEEIGRTDAHVAIQLKLEAAFGLRAQESWRLRPARDTLPSGYLFVRDGTKGGRPRQVKIEFEWQYDLLAEAAELAAITNPTRGSMIPALYSQEEWRRRFYAVLEKHGITKAQSGITAHGLRHQFMQQMYERITGEPSPIKGGRVVSQEMHLEAIQKVVKAAGHSRATKANAYLSTHKTMERFKRTHVTPAIAVEAVKLANGVKLRAAENLGIPRTSLYRLLALAEAAKA